MKKQPERLCKDINTTILLCQIKLTDCESISVNVLKTSWFHKNIQWHKPSDWYASWVSILYVKICRAGGFDKDGLTTIPLLSAVQTSGQALGSMFGPVIGGAVTEHLSFSWAETTFAFMNAILVRTTINLKTLVSECAMSMSQTGKSVIIRCSHNSICCKLHIDYTISLFSGSGLCLLLYSHET